MPVSKKNIEEMYSELVKYIDGVKNKYLNTLLNNIFVNDTEYAQRFKNASAAKSVHHGFIGGLLEHTLGVVKLCDYYCNAYPILNRDLLITAAICHDMGKTKEISAFPLNDYTDEGQFLGHIVIGAEMVGEKAREIEGFPPMLEMELKHCILSHHGEFEFGSPKKPAIVEAVALNFADNTDAKIETFTELLESTTEKGWLGFNKLFDSKVRGTQV
jgi:3'-5' exoribonuclease